VWGVSACQVQTHASMIKMHPFTVYAAVPAGMDLQCPTVPRCATNPAQWLCTAKASEFLRFIQQYVVSPDKLVFADM
jgi:hypothetical protein